MGMHMCASKRECMGSHKQVSLHKISWNNESRPRAITKAKSTLVFGHTIGDPFALPSVWTTLVSNMSENNTLTISSKPLGITTKSPWTGRDADISGLTSFGITKTASSTFQCPGTVKKLDSAFNTPSQINCKINHTPVRLALMAPSNNYVPVQTHHQHWTSNKRLLYKK